MLTAKTMKINGIHFVRRLFGCKDRKTSNGLSLGEIMAGIIATEIGHGTVWDGLAGSAFIGMTLKRRRMRVISSDIRPSCWLRAITLVGQNKVVLSVNSIRSAAMTGVCKPGWFCENDLPLLGRKNAEWLDWLHQVVLPSFSLAERLEAVFGVIWAIETLLQRGSRFLHMHRNWHGETLCGGWHMRNDDLSATWLEFMLNDFPKLIFDNGQDNPCLYGDVVDLASHVVADAAYFDPPYAGLFASYQGFYGLVDEWPRILLGKDIPPEPDNKPHGRFSGVTSSIASFALLMARSKSIPLWIISYSDSDTMRVTPEDISVLAKSEGRTVDILRFPFKQSVSKKHAIPKRYNECLIVCKDEERLEQYRLS